MKALALRSAMKNIMQLRRTEDEFYTRTLQVTKTQEARTS